MVVQIQRQRKMSVGSSFQRGKGSTFTHTETEIYFEKRNLSGVFLRQSSRKVNYYSLSSWLVTKVEQDCRWQLAIEYKKANSTLDLSQIKPIDKVCYQLGGRCKKKVGRNVCRERCCRRETTRFSPRVSTSATDHSTGWIIAGIHPYRKNVPPGR